MAIWVGGARAVSGARGAHHEVPQHQQHATSQAQAALRDVV
jgi:hypothetical protein